MCDTDISTFLKRVCIFIALDFYLRNCAALAAYGRREGNADTENGANDKNNNNSSKTIAQIYTFAVHETAKTNGLRWIALRVDAIHRVRRMRSQFASIRIFTFRKVIEHFYFWHSFIAAHVACRTVGNRAH